MNVVVLVGLLVTLATIGPVIVLLRKHPRGLSILFFAEMWERFSYYGMRGLLIFYLTQHFLFDDHVAQGQYGAYTSLVYLAPLIGGFLADRYLGTRKAISIGALFLVAGHLTMAVEQPPAQQALIYQGQTYHFAVQGRMEARDAKLAIGDGLYEFGAASDGGLEIHGLPAGAPLPAHLPKNSFTLSVEGRQPVFLGVMYLALSLIIVGVGFLKANISSIVGQLYAGPDDPRRDSGFTLYYYGINLGAFWAAILCGLLGQSVGWWAGFGLAGLGMAAGWAVFTLGRPLLEGKGEPPAPEKLKEPVLGPLNREWLIYLGGLLAVAVVWLLVQRFESVGLLLAVGSAVTVRYFFAAMANRLSPEERGRMWLALILIAGSVVFWTLFEQAGTSLNQFAERNTQLPNNGFLSMSAAQTQSFNAGFILLLAPAFSLLWAWLATHGRNPSAPNKFALALAQVGLGFLVLVWGAQFADAQARVPLIFLALAYLLHTTGELCLSPVGLSQMTKLSTPLLLSTLMATWFLASSWAQWLGGMVARLTAAETIAGEVLDPHKALATYVQVFQQIGWAAIALGLAFWLFEPFVKKLAHGVK